MTPLYAALNLVCSVRSLVDEKNALLIVLAGFGLWNTSSITSSISFAYLVSLAPPYISPRIPHQYHLDRILIVFASLHLLFPK